jgi:hypothetical protein
MNPVDIPNMNDPGVFTSLTEAARIAPDGACVEIGTWLGASARSAMDGYLASGREPDLHLYDRWKATDSPNGRSV